LQRVTSPKFSGTLNVFLRWGIPSPQVYEDLVTSNIIQTYAEVYPNIQINLFLLSETKYLLVGNGEVLLFDDTTLLKKIATSMYHPANYLMVNNRLMFVDEKNEWHIVNHESGEIINCSVTGDNISDDEQKIFLQDFHCGIAPAYFGFIKQANRLYEIQPTNNSTTFQLRRVIDDLPEGCLIKSLAFDSTRKIYAIGTDSKGLYVYRQNTLHTIVTKEFADGTSNVYYSQLALDSNHILTSSQRIFSTIDHSVSKFEFTTLAPYALYRDSKNHIWFSRDTQIIYYDDSRKLLRSYRKKIGADITAFCEVGDKLWIGAQEGLGYLKDDSVTIVPSFINSKVNCFVSLNENSLLIGTGSGAYFFNTQNFTVDTVGGLEEVNIRTIESLGDLMFIGSYGNGFFLMKNGTVIHAPEDRYGHMTDVHAFFTDANGFVWMTTNHGLFKTTIASLQEYFRDSTASVFYYRYGVEDGMLTDEFNGGCQPSHLRLAGGTESLPSLEGLVWMKPEEVAMDMPTEKISIEKITVDHKSLAVNDSLMLPCNYRQVSIQFSTPYWGSKENLWMDYRISGDREEWMPLEKEERTILLSRLPYGHYLLQIRKRSGFDSSDWVIENLPITIAPFFYQTWWFISCCVVAFVLMIWMVVKFNSATVRRRNKRLEELIQLRTNELQNANTALVESEIGLQRSVRVKDKLISIISHDIITPLRFISLSAKLAHSHDGNDSSGLKNTLDDIRNAAVKLHDNSQNILNWINQQNHRIRVVHSNVSVFALVEEIIDQLDEIRTQREIEMINQVPEDDIIVTDERLLGIILQNVISNSVKHTRNGTIWVSAEDEKEHYKITVSDNGNGMPEEILQRINNASEEQILVKQKQKMISAAAG
jgi:signal transduction histidine kinase